MTITPEPIQKDHHKTILVAARKAPGPKEITNFLGMKFVYIPPGTFMMGSPATEAGREVDESRHQVTLTKGFYMQTTEVTQGQWRAVMDGNPSKFKGCGDNCPVETVSWNYIQMFIDKLNKKQSSRQYRLPTEAHWEYAARAGSQWAFANGDISETKCGHDPKLDAMGWYCGNSGGKPHPVARKMPNRWGLYDMHGNVWEWVEDDWQDKYQGVPQDGSAWVEKHRRSPRVVRGGSCFSPARECRSASRSRFWPETFSDNGPLGFRLVLLPGQ